MSLPAPRSEAPLRVLIIDDELDVATTLKRVVEDCCGYEVRARTEPGDLSRELDAWTPDLVFTDLVMPGIDGFQVIEHVRALNPDIPVVVVSAYSSIENAVRAVKLGAFDFLAKPFDPESVELVIAKVAREVAQRRRNEDLIRHDRYLAALVGESVAMRRVRDWIRRVRDVSTNVLIQGETGTGKELVARAIHAGRGPFVPVNMAAIPVELGESELFGHRQGAFTGATSERQGLLVEAHGGTLFLDEVNAMDPALQAKLLRVIQDKRVRPIGANKELPADFRLICATNENLEDKVREGRFRRDLFHRINVLSIVLPKLSERPDDIPVLAHEFLHRYARAHGRHVRRFTPEALKVLMAREWPGNVRELENVIEQAVIFSPDHAVEVTADLVRPGGLPDRAGDEDGSGFLFSGDPVPLAEMESRYIRYVLQWAQGNKSKAARALAIDYKTLLRNLKSSAE